MTTEPAARLYQVADLPGLDFDPVLAQLLADEPVARVRLPYGKGEATSPSPGERRDRHRKRPTRDTGTNRSTGVKFCNQRNAGSALATTHKRPPPLRAPIQLSDDRPSHRYLSRSSEEQ